MNFRDNIVALGKGICRVEISRRNVVTGEVIPHEGPNTIVNNYYSQLTYLLAGTGLASRRLANIEFGTGNTTPVATDTTITHLSPPVLIPVTVTNPTVLEARCVAEWGAGEINAADITEVGLLFADNSLAARHVFSAMKKSADWTWNITWTIKYVL